MNASYLINAPLSWQVCFKRPSLTKAPCLITPPPPSFPETNSDIEEAGDENSMVHGEDSDVDIEL